MIKTTVKISSLHNNTGQIKGLPKNPRFIKDKKFEKLKKSLQDDPEMMVLRELIVYDNNGQYVVIGGNMRLKALKELGVTDVPVKILPTDTPIEKLKAFAIKDNVAYGQTDWDELANNWQIEELVDWGVDLPIEDAMTEEELQAEENKKAWSLKIKFDDQDSALELCARLMREGYNVELK